MNLFDKKLIGVFIVAFLFAVVISAPVSVDDTKTKFVDSVVSAFGTGGGDGCGGCGGPDGGGPGDPGGGGEPPKVCADPNALNYLGSLPCQYPPFECELIAGPTLITKGDTATLTWTAKDAKTAEIDKGVGSVSPASGGSVQVSPIVTTTYTMTAKTASLSFGSVVFGGKTATCKATIRVKDPEPSTPDIKIIKRDAVDKDDMQTVNKGGVANFEILVKNTGDVDLKNVVVTDPKTPNCDRNLGSLVVGEQKTYTCIDSDIQEAYTNIANVEGKSVDTDEKVTDSDPSHVKVREPKAPSCDSFTANPDWLPVGGGNVTLIWETSNAGTVSIDNGVGVVNADGSTVVSVTDDITYTLTASKIGFDPDICTVDIEVGDSQKDPISCAANVAFSANPSSLPVGGGNVELTWSTSDIETVKLDGVAQNLNDSTVINITDDTTFELEVTGDNSTTGNTEICPLTVLVDDPTDEFSCENNATFTASDTNVRKNDNVTLTWTTTGATDVSINNGIGDVSLDGNTVVNVDNDITYILTISNGTDSDQCPVSIDVESGGGGGGGGGSSSPRCDFEISDDEIDEGDEVTLSWETSRGEELTIYEGDEDDDNEIFETDDEDEVDEGEIRVRPTKDTEYTLVVKRGSRDRDCTVEVEVNERDDEVFITSIRDQGQVAGISLTAVPYTGFEAGPMLTFIFYAILAVWGLFVAYVLVIREDSLLGVSLAGAFSEDRVITDDYSTNAQNNEMAGESIAAQYVASATAVAPAAVATTSTGTMTGGVAPSNLPTGEYNPPMGYAAAQAQKEAVADPTVACAANPAEDELKELEDRAHEQKVLLSSDAMRHLIAVCPRDIRRVVFLDEIIKEAKVTYPTEDGWVVLNLDRMTTVCSNRKTAQSVATMATPEKIEVAPEKKIEATDLTGVGSLAESIVSGNIAAAYQMIGHRPMIALADAAADLDTLYRARKGEQVAVSDMLQSETKDITTEQLEAAIEALTCAIDGTYTDEAAAVKMAIMKATKALA